LLFDLFAYLAAENSCLFCFQCFDTDVWHQQNVWSVKKLGYEVLTWLSVWSKVEMLYMGDNENRGSVYILLCKVHTVENFSDVS